ncbi:MAG: hypothetical protein Q4C80_06995 [Bacillota bacterium]|nr:hypothetical protein [Bacillota bacterium]
MKKIFSAVNRQLMSTVIIVIIVGMALTGCGGSDKTPEFLTEHEWVHYDSACDETISFGEDGHFAFYCACGDPVGDSDVYDRYSYDSESGEINLKPAGDMSIKVLRHKNSRLLLDINGDVKEFVDEKDKLIAGGAPQNLAYDTDNTVSGFSSYLSIIDKDGSEIITAPANYDGDDPDFKEYELSETLANDAEFYDWTYSVDESGKHINAESKYKMLTEKEASRIIKNGSAVGFVWYNEDAEITKIVLWGSTIRQ